MESFFVLHKVTNKPTTIKWSLFIYTHLNPNFAPLASVGWPIDSQGFLIDE